MSKLIPLPNFAKKAEKIKMRFSESFNRIGRRRKKFEISRVHLRMPTYTPMKFSSEGIFLNRTNV